MKYTLWWKSLVNYFLYSANIMKYSYWFQSFFLGSTIALQHAKEALKLNSKEADWHFLMGKLLSRVRHFSQDHEITSAEISHLQTAFKLAETPRSAIFLANAYIEKSRTLNSESYKNGNRPSYEVRNRIKELSAEAKSLIK